MRHASRADRARRTLCQHVESATRSAAGSRYSGRSRRRRRGTQSQSAAIARGTRAAARPPFGCGRGRMSPLLLYCYQHRPFEAGKEKLPRHTSPMSVTASIRQQLTPIHREGYPFIGAFALASLVLFWIWPPLGWLGVIATLWCIYFFRDPARVTPIREGIVVAPADGRVCQVVSVVPPRELDLGERPLPRISIFMSVFDCHINRSPVGGHIERIVYRAGKFISADLDKASEDNERNTFVIGTGTGQRIAVVQIAGLIARRIVCFAREGDGLGAGQR